jgi:cyclophilin family peptidyl-prolyl cis-trans isomerase
VPSSHSDELLLYLHTDVPVGDGTIVIQLKRDWAPLGVEHLLRVVASHFYTDAAFFRVVPHFVVQFGLAAVPAANRQWATPIADDPVVASNVEGTVTYATAGPGTRTTQLFVNTGDNAFLDKQGFAPIGSVVQGMDVAHAIFNPTPGNSGGVNQTTYGDEGNAWITKMYPGINLITSATVVPM